MAIGFGVNGWVWTSPFTNESLSLFDKAAKFGFDAFEIPLEDPTVLDADEVSRRLKGAGIRAIVCGAFGPSRDLTSDDPKFRKESLDYIKTALKLCEKWGSKVLVGPMYSAVGKRRHVPPDQKKAEWELAVKGLQKAGKMAGDHGVKLGLEPLNRFETDLINTAAQALQMVKDVGDDNVRIHLDTFHMHIEEKSIYDAVKTAGKALCHMHVCENDRGTPGTGQVDWKGLAKGLSEVGYKGDCAIESFTPTCKAIAAAAAIWRPLAKNQDDIARDGLKFLKKTLK